MKLQEFIEKFAEALEIENPNNLSAKTLFRDLDEWSSLSVILLIAFFEEEYGKEIGNIDIKSCETINDLFNLTKK